ncbi:NADH-ubiquinone oxidoreductase-F iron-sulfur binding region domain-containing protein, partial [Planctomycetota bacterium]
RAEYPLAVVRLREALDILEKQGWLGENIKDSGHDFRLHIVQGAGAFVCGEETALIAAVEGKRGMPRFRPPYPAAAGVFGRPTLVNNVETYALVPGIISGEEGVFKKLGTDNSSGTKSFALAGKVVRGGLVEVPMGITIREIVEKIGGGIQDGKAFKAVQIGGPSGGCVPASLADTPIDYDALTSAGAIMGSGGLVVLDETDCMVDIAKYFLAFTQLESCGKCTFCRVGTKRMLEILERITGGEGREEDIAALEELAATIMQGSLCQLGGTAPNPVLSTIRHFRDEYEAHINGRCPAGKCKALIAYAISDECIGCTRCSQRCPAEAIPMTPYEKHIIDAEKCIRCDTCRQVCPVDAVEVR